MQKRSKSITISCTTQDVAIAEVIRDTVKPFPPSKSTLALLLFRHGLCELLRGNLTLVALAEAYSEVNMETLAEQIAGEKK